MSSKPDSLELLLNQGYRYALSLCHEPSRADDLLQDGWMALLQAKGPQETGYLFSAIRSRYLNQIKRDNLVPMVALESDFEAQAVSGTESQIIFDDMQELGLALDALRPVEREALFLSAAIGFTAEEIGKHTGQSRGTVLSLVHRAKKKLNIWISEQQEATHG